MVNEGRYKRSYKTSSSRKKFPVVRDKLKSDRSGSKQFDWGMSQEDYHKVMFKLYTWVQAEYAGEISIEVITRKASELSRNNFLTTAQVTAQVGTRTSDVAPRSYERLVEDAQKIYHKKRETYIESVKKFIGNLLKEFVSPELTVSIQSEPDYMTKVNVITNAADFMDWFEKAIFKLMRWQTNLQITDLETLIINKINIAGNSNSGIKYLASIELALEGLKRLKLNKFIEDHVVSSNGNQPDEELKSRFEVAITKEVEKDGMIIQRIYKECKEHGLSRELRETWIHQERMKHLRDGETPYTTVKETIAEIRKDFDYMLRTGQNNKSNGFVLNINTVELKENEKCRTCVGEKGMDRVNHRWYDCFKNPKSKKYKPPKSEGKDKMMQISVTEYNKLIKARNREEKKEKNSDKNKVKFNVNTTVVKEESETEESVSEESPSEQSE
jgi:hypothetical protein